MKNLIIVVALLSVFTFGCGDTHTYERETVREVPAQQQQTPQYNQTQPTNTGGQVKAGGAYVPSNVNRSQPRTGGGYSPSSTNRSAPASSKPSSGGYKPRGR